MEFLPRKSHSKRQKPALTESNQKEGEHTTKIGEVYLWEISSNKAKILKSEARSLICCGQPVKLVET
jgi:hypothetical protein